MALQNKPQIDATKRHQKDEQKIFDKTELADLGRSRAQSVFKGLLE
jgi:hypothetical protein